MLLNRKQKRMLASLGFIAVNGENMQMESSIDMRKGLHFEPHPHDHTKLAPKPWFFWRIHCPHERLWTQSCAMCPDGLKRGAEREARMVAFVRTCS